MSEEVKNPLSISEIFGLINDANKNLEHDVYIPSLNKEIHLKPLNALHSKNIAKAALDGAFSQNQFNIIMYNILKDISDPSVPLSQINILDKISILLELRNKNIKPFLEVELSDGNGNKKIVSVDLPPLLKKIKKLKFSFDDEIIELDSYKIYLNYPSIETEYNFETHLYKTKIQGMTNKDEANMKIFATSMMISAITQFIKRIDIGENSIVLTGKRVNECTDIFEKLPGSIFHQIMTKIEKVFAEKINKILNVTQVIDEVEYKGSIEISPNLFLS